MSALLFRLGLVMNTSTKKGSFRDAYCIWSLAEDVFLGIYDIEHAVLFIYVFGEYILNRLLRSKKTIAAVVLYEQQKCISGKNIEFLAQNGDYLRAVEVCREKELGI